MYDVFIAYYGTNDDIGTYKAAKVIADHLISKGFSPFVCHYCGFEADSNISYQNTTSVIYNSHLFLLVINNNIHTRLNANGAICSNDGKYSYLVGEMDSFATISQSKDKSNVVSLEKIDLDDEGLQSLHPLFRGHKEYLSGYTSLEAIENWVRKYLEEHSIVSEKNHYGYYKDQNYGRSFNVLVGDTVDFGQYYKNNSNEKEPIKWNVVEIDNDSILLVSKDIIERHRFSKTGNIYASSELATFLNTVFYQNAFSEEEKNRLLPVRENLLVAIPDEAILNQCTSLGADKKFITKYASLAKTYNSINYELLDEPQDEYYLYWLDIPSMNNRVKVYSDESVPSIENTYVTYVGIVPVIRIKK